jgi:hypothetical protein
MRGLDPRKMVKLFVRGQVWWHITSPDTAHAGMAALLPAPSIRPPQHGQPQRRMVHDCFSVSKVPALQSRPAAAVGGLVRGENAAAGSGSAGGRATMDARVAVAPFRRSSECTPTCTTCAAMTNDTRENASFPATADRWRALSMVGGSTGHDAGPTRRNAAGQARYGTSAAASREASQPTGFGG